MSYDKKKIRSSVVIAATKTSAPQKTTTGSGINLYLSPNLNALDTITFMRNEQAKRLSTEQPTSSIIETSIESSPAPSADAKAPQTSESRAQVKRTLLLNESRARFTKQPTHDLLELSQMRLQPFIMQNDSISKLAKLHLDNSRISSGAITSPKMSRSIPKRNKSLAAKAANLKEALQQRLHARNRNSEKQHGHYTMNTYEYGRDIWSSRNTIKLVSCTDEQHVVRSRSCSPRDVTAARVNDQNLNRMQLINNNIRQMAANSSQRTVNLGQHHINNNFAVSPMDVSNKSTIQKEPPFINNVSQTMASYNSGNTEAPHSTIKLQYGSSRLHGAPIQATSNESPEAQREALSAHKKHSLNKLEQFTQQNYERMQALALLNQDVHAMSNDVKSAAAAALVKEVMRKRVIKQKQKIAIANQVENGGGGGDNGYTNVVAMGKRHWHQTVADGSFGNWATNGQAWSSKQQQQNFLTNASSINTPAITSTVGSQSGRSIGVRKPGQSLSSQPDNLKRQMDARLSKQKQYASFYRGGGQGINISFKSRTDGNSSQLSEVCYNRKTSQQSGGHIRITGATNMVKSQQNWNGKSRANMRSRLEQSHIIDEQSLIEMGYGISLQTNHESGANKSNNESAGGEKKNIKIVSGEQDFLYKSTTSCPDEVAAHNATSDELNRSIGIRTNYPNYMSNGKGVSGYSQSPELGVRSYENDRSNAIASRSETGERQARSRKRTGKAKPNDHGRHSQRRESVIDRNAQKPLMTDALLMRSTESLKNLSGPAASPFIGEQDKIPPIVYQDRYIKMHEQKMRTTNDNEPSGKTRWTEDMTSLASVAPRGTQRNNQDNEEPYKSNLISPKPLLNVDEKSTTRMIKPSQGKRRTITGTLSKGKSVERINFGLSNLPESPAVKIKRAEKQKGVFQEASNLNVNNFNKDVNKKAKDMTALTNSQEQHNKSQLSGMRQEPLIRTGAKQNRLLKQALDSRMNPQAGSMRKSKAKWPGIHKSSSSSDLHYGSVPRVHQLFTNGTTNASISGQAQSPQGAAAPNSRVVPVIDVQVMQKQFLELKTLIRHIVKRQEQPLPYTWSGTPYRYQVLPGNNASLIERVFHRSMRQLYWTSCHNWVNTASSAKLHQSHSKFSRRESSIPGYEPQFKWSPCSIKSDFDKFFSMQARSGNSVPLKTGFHIYGKNNGQNSRRQIKSLMLRPRHLLNHFEGHKELTRKDELISNLRQQLQYENENIFDYTPVTFGITVPEGKQPQLEHFFKKFIAFFENFERGKQSAAMMHQNERGAAKKTPVMVNQNAADPSNHVDTTLRPFSKIWQHLLNLSIKAGPQYRAMLQRESSTRYLMPSCHFIGGNYWILKTTYQNRGIGIHVFKSMKQLNKIIKNFIMNAREEKAGSGYGGTSSLHESHSPHVSQYIINQSMLRPNGGMRPVGVEPRSPSRGRPGSQDATASASGSRPPTFMQQAVQVPKNLSFIIQKYIEKPLLIRRRKFDIRVWVLVNQDMEVFFFKEGYLRTSAYEYKLDDCDDPYVHLTNNAVQKNARSYGKYEDGNQLDFDEFQAYIDENYNNKLKEAGRRPIDVRLDLVEDMKFIVSKTLDAVKKKLDPQKRNGCFEIFGYDFMIDADFSVWLIECNTNPCLDESSQLLRRILPRMIDDAFRLTIDRDFPSPLVTWRDQLRGYIANLRLNKGCQAQQVFSQKAANNYGAFDAQQDMCNMQSPAGSRGDTRDPRAKLSSASKKSPQQAQQLPIAKRLEQAESLLSSIEREIRLSDNPSRFQLNNYSDEENLWQKIMDLRGNSGQACKNLLNLKKRDRIIRAQNCIVAPSIMLPGSLDGAQRIYMSNYESYAEFKKFQKTAVSQVHL